MKNDYKNPAFKKMLDSLQQQSWELELIISGFAIFGLFTAYDPLKIEMINAQNNEQVYSLVVYLVLLLACSILLFNLLLHVVMRGLWIGALGLRYVSGDIDFDVLNYNSRFKNYLSKKIVSFDRYIGNLENYCSILFAISFLLVFYVLAITIIIITIVLISFFIINNDSLPDWLSKGLGVTLVLFVVFGMFLTFIDFITQGLLKRNKWIAKMYFPFYWVFSFLTLSFLYRPLVYNFLDNKFGKRLILLLTPVYFAILLITSLEYRNSNFLDDKQDSSNMFANQENYFDMLVKDEDFPGEVAIPSKVITTNYLQVFIPFSEGIEDRIFSFKETLKPEKDRRGLTSSIQFSISWDDRIKSKKQKDSIRKLYLNVFNEMYSFEIDSITKDSDFIVTTGIKNILGFETYLDIKDLQEGLHTLRIKRKQKKKDSISTVTREVIPFWYFKE
ncbi:hypothetical protein LV716_01940 [Flagellimonas sp. HMM57]|uniref:hypothetical protein n=1 Tax=unclassified Flagellimonas TaxID=2644544 RepID=UPI0013D2EC31|nr:MULTISPECIES: hypothetical protein [unclassified Flagellimonas]UII76575.1 hypothetical protein LV716_01940 [Flagellimonas sp. HMM57]